MDIVTTIHCCGCGHAVNARLTDGREIYPHRPDLAGLPFWRCDTCKNFVGCHHKTKQRTNPLGVIPTPEIKKARQHIHAILDPLWKDGLVNRGKLYAMIAKRIGRQYHTAELASVDEAREVYRVVRDISKQLVSED